MIKTAYIDNVLLEIIYQIGYRINKYIEIFNWRGISMVIFGSSMYRSRIIILFMMNMSAAQIKLNYEFHLRGVARDHGIPALQDSVPVIITIKDSSTRPPTFVQRPNLTYLLPETYRDTETPIAQVKAV